MAFNLLRLVPTRLLVPHSFSTISITSDLVQTKSTNVNVLDTFTTELLARISKEPQQSSPNSAKNNVNKSRGQQKSLLEKITLHQKDKNVNQHSCDIRTLSKTEFDQYVILSITNDDRRTFSDIIHQVINYKLLPSDEVILRAMSYLCDDQSETVQNFTKLINVCMEKNIAFYATNQQFLPYLAQYYWEACQFDYALNALQQIYATDSKSIRILVENNFKKLLRNSIANRSDENAIDKIENLAITIYRRYKQSSLLLHVWNKCFISVWFVDQERAGQLFKDYDVIRSAFSKNVASYVFDMLQRHEVDAVYRLIELCLSYDMNEECFICLSLLFDYQCKFPLTQISGISE